ncbi:MAG TPA: peptidoglycan DD-metalloendopeptidase family protein [Syntrophomonadaceae bacterium]|nr:peptidoglycan DD-metalloendopeptidase family protein [Syntrophomonadaceae bacterium]
MIRKKNRNKKRLTFIVIPQDASKPYKLNTSTRTIMAIATSMVLLIVITISIAIAFYGSRMDIRTVRTLKQDNNRQVETINLLDQEIKEIEMQKEQITKKQDEIKKLMGIKESEAQKIEPTAGGKGGADLKTDGYMRAHTEAFNRVQGIKTYLNRQEQELDELIAQVDDRPEYFRSIPNQWPVTGNITSPYGWRESPFGGKNRSFHEGIDIANQVGADIVAAADGKVIFAGWQSVYGKTVIIDHAFGFTTKYSHNSALLVEVGDQVKKGEVIAALGSTGRSTGPHLHFAVIKWGKTQDPLIYLP